MVPKRVFILTPSTGFGDLIHQVLEDTGSYQASLFSNPKDALEMARKDAVALFILDAELGAQATPALVAELREAAPLSRLVIIPTEENPHDPQLKLIGADAILPSPFYLPDLIAAIEQFFGPLLPRETPKRSTYGDAHLTVQPPSRPETSAPAWLEDVSLTARYLTRLSLESASRAALITRGGKVWAYAGELPKQAADELAAAVAEHTADNNQSDLARFIHLTATDVDYMLYATGLGSDFTLALAFDAQIPFSQMRSQVTELAKALATAPQLLQSTEMEMGEPQESHAETHMQNGESERPSAQPARAMGMAQTETVANLPNHDSMPGRLETPAPAGIDLHYSYVLIPRLPKHRLGGDLAEKLSEWLPELCLAFAWRLEGISIQPDFLQWALSMPPDASPISVVQTLDKYLSGNIFEFFPRLARDNPSGHFWAPGYLVVSGAQLSPARISDHIQRTRARQGVPR